MVLRYLHDLPEFIKQSNFVQSLLDDLHREIKVPLLSFCTLKNILMNFHRLLLR